MDQNLQNDLKRLLYKELRKTGEDFNFARCYGLATAYCKLSKLPTDDKSIEKFIKVASDFAKESE